MSRVPKQFENLLDYGKVENSKFYEPFKALDGDSDEVIEIQEEAMRVIHHEVMPAFQKLKGMYIGMVTVVEFLSGASIFVHSNELPNRIF